MNTTEKSIPLADPSRYHVWDGVEIVPWSPTELLDAVSRPVKITRACEDGQSMMPVDSLRVDQPGLYCLTHHPGTKAALRSWVVVVPHGDGLMRLSASQNQTDFTDAKASIWIRNALAEGYDFLDIVELRHDGDDYLYWLHRHPKSAA